MVEKVRDGFLKVTDNFGTVKTLGSTYTMSTLYIKSPSEHAVIFYIFILKNVNNWLDYGKHVRSGAPSEGKEQERRGYCFGVLGRPG